MPTNSNWVAGVADNNWSTGTGTTPGAADTALFNNASSILALSINNPTVAIGSINFDTAAGSYTIGTAAGGVLDLSAGDSIAILSTLTAGSKTETIAAPLVLEGATYAFTNSGTSSSTVLDIGPTTGAGTVSATVASTALTLGGTNLGVNTVFDSITDGTGSLSVVKTGAGSWILSGTNTYSQGTTISGGTLTFGANGLPSTGLVTINAAGTLAASGPYATLTTWLNSGKISTASTGALAITTASDAEALDFSSTGPYAAYTNLSIGATVTSTYSGVYTPGTGGYRFGGGVGALTVSSLLSGNNALTIDASPIVTSTGVVILTNASNSFTGPTTTGGLLRISSLADLGTTSAITVLNNGDLELTASGTYAFPNTLTISGSGTNYGALVATGSGTTTWTGNIVLGLDQTRIGTSNLTGILNLTGNISSGTSVYGPAIRNLTSTSVAGLANEYVEFSGNDTYLGGTSIVVGLLKLGSTTALPATTVVTLGSASGNLIAELDLNGNSSKISGLATAGGSTTNWEQVLVTSASPATLTISSTSTNSFATGSLTGQLGITKLGTGIQTISDTGASTYSGTTTLGGGTLAYDATVFATSTNPSFGDSNGALVLDGGILKLTGRANGTVTGALTASFTSLSPVITLSTAASLVVGQAVTGTNIPSGSFVGTVLSSTTFVLGNGGVGGYQLPSGTGTSVTLAAATNSTSQTFNGTTLTTGYNSLSSILGGSSTTLVLGAITRTAPSATTPGAGTFDIPATSTGTVTTTTGNTGGTIFGGFATVGGNTWAVSAATNNGVPGAITGLPQSGYTTSTASGEFTGGTDALAGKDVDFGASDTAVASTGTKALSINSLRFNTNTAPTLSAGTAASGLALTIATGGILQTTGMSTTGISIVNGTLTSGTSDLVLTNNSAQNMAISSTIIDNGGTSVGVTKSGTGLYTSYAANTYSGSTTLLSGTYVPQNSSVFSAGAVINGPLGTGTLVFAGGTVRAPSTGAFLIGNKITLAADPVVPASNTFANIYTGQVTILGSSQNFTTNSAGDVVLSGAIIDGGSPSSALTKLGTGQLVVTGANTYTGGTTVSAGTLAGTTAGLEGPIVDNATVLFDQTLPADTAGSATTASTNKMIVSYGGATLTNNSGTFIGSISGTGAVTQSSVNAAASTVIFTGPNTYSGLTTLNGGTLVANNTTGSGTGTGIVNINSTGALGGTGFITGVVNVNVGTTAAGGRITAGSGFTAGSSTGNLTTTGGAGNTTFSQNWNGASTATLAGGYVAKFNPNNLGTPGAVIGTTSPVATADPGGRGANWDELTMASLNIIATSTNQFDITTVDLTTGIGTATPFSATGTYSWPIAVLTNGVTGLYVNGAAVVTNSASPTAQTDLLAAITPLLRLDPTGLLAATGVPAGSSADFSIGVAPDPNNALYEDIVVSYNGAPEPTSFCMLGLGAAGLVMRRRRRASLVGELASQA